MLPASREEVFDMWLSPNNLRRWMCPGDSSLVYVELNPVVGGAFRFDMQTKDGRVVVHTGEYLQICRPEKLVFTWHSTILGEHASQVTVEFHKQGENCLLVLVHDLPPDQALFDDHRRGWTTILNLLAEAQRANSR